MFLFTCFISFFFFFFLRVKERINFYNKTLIIKVINYRTHSLLIMISIIVFNIINYSSTSSASSPSSSSSPPPPPPPVLDMAMRVAGAGKKAGAALGGADIDLYMYKETGKPYCTSDNTVCRHTRNVLMCA